MEKRLVLALFVSLIAIFAYSYFFPAKPRQAASQNVAQEPLASATPKPAESMSPLAEAESAYPKIVGEKEEEIVLETAHHYAVFTTRGGLLQSLRLKGYYPHARLSEEEKKKKENWLLLIEERKKGDSALSLYDIYNKLGTDPNKAIWKAGKLPEGDGIEFTLATGNGVTLRKQILFPAGSFHARVALEAANANPEFTGADWIFEFAPTGGVRFDAQEQKLYPHPVSAVAYRKLGGELEYATFLPRGESQPMHAFPTAAQDKPISFLGNYSKYFAALCIPQESTRFDYAKGESIFDEKEFELRKAAGNPEPAKGLYHLSAVRGGVSMHLSAPGGTERKQFLLYLGPKDPAILKDGEKHPEYAPFVAMLEDDVWLVGRFLMWLLKGFWVVTQNYGVAIILLTLLVRVALFPLNRKQQIAMASYQKKMAKIQPQIEALKKKYKDQRQKLQEEQMKLFKEHGITPPLMGCLPIVLQLPVFIGLFTALKTDFAIRQAPFLWVDDLSMPDKLIDFGRTYGFWPFDFNALNLLPILMVVVWVIQARTAPTPTDPQQAQMQKIMTWMPLMFGVMLYDYAAGLSLYMTISSAWGIWEQKTIKRKLEAAKAA